MTKDVGWQAVVASFGYIGKLKSKCRKERRLTLESIPLLLTPGARIGVTPVLMTRVSPLADKMGPTPDMDKAPAVKLADVMDPLPVPPDCPSTWDKPLMG